MEQRQENLTAEAWELETICHLFSQLNLGGAFADTTTELRIWEHRVQGIEEEDGDVIW